MRHQNGCVVMLDGHRFHWLWYWKIGCFFFVALCVGKDFGMASRSDIWPLSACARYSIGSEFVTEAPSPLRTPHRRFSTWGPTDRANGSHPWCSRISKRIRSKRVSSGIWKTGGGSWLEYFEIDVITHLLIFSLNFEIWIEIKKLAFIWIGS